MGGSLYRSESANPYATYTASIEIEPPSTPSTGHVTAARFSKALLHFRHLGFRPIRRYAEIMEAMHPRSTRCWPRYQVNLPVRMLVRKPGMLRLAYARGQELNAGGMAVCAIVELAVGDEVQLEFLLGRSRQPIRLKATVRNRVDHQYGLEFLATNPAEERGVRALRKMIAGSSRPPRLRN